MNIMKLMCTAFAVTLVISACGKTEGTNALKSEARVENPGTETGTTPAAAPQEMAVSDALNALWSSRDGFLVDDNCVMLEGSLPSEKSSTPVAFYKGGCQTTSQEGKGKQDQEKGKELAFKLDAIQEVAEPVKGGKDDVVKPVEPKQQQKPVDRVYSLILRGTPGKSDKGEQVQSTPDMKVGEFVVHTYYEIPEKGKEEQKGQVVEQEQGKPEQGKSEPEQGKSEPEQGQPEAPEQGKVEPEQGKPEAPEQGKPEQGKDQVVEQEQGKPEQGKPEQEGKPEGIERTKLVLTKLCSDEYADACEVIFDAGRFDAIRLLGVAPEQDKGEQKGQVVEQEQGKSEPEQGKVEPVKEEIQKLEQEKAQQQAKVEQIDQELAKGQEQLVQEQDKGKKEQLEQKQQQLQQEKQKAQQELKQTQEKVEQAQQKQKELEEKQV